MDTLCYIWGLLLQSHQHIASLEVKSWGKGKAGLSGCTWRTQVAASYLGDCSFLTWHLVVVCVVSKQLGSVWAPS